ncbi:MAG: hypothetical protein P4L69_01820 [Desulfosporosinus sp.]|nr:hypothetical protein [Desulfosporosinus sp.]
MQTFIPCVAQAKLTPQTLAPAGCPATRHPTAMDGLVSPEPRMA